MLTISCMFLCGCFHPRKHELEEAMLLNLSRSTWTRGLALADFTEHNSANEKGVAQLKALADRYDKVSTAAAYYPSTLSFVVGRPVASPHSSAAGQ